MEAFKEHLVSNTASKVAVYLFFGAEESVDLVGLDHIGQNAHGLLRTLVEVSFDIASIWDHVLEDQFLNAARDD